MSAVNAHLSKLRSLLHEGASCWSDLCELLIDWPGRHGLDVALDYTERHIEAWPEQVREAPPRWWVALEEGQMTPAWRLIRSLKLPLSGLVVQDALALLPRLEGQVRFSQVYVHGVRLERDEWEMLFNSPTLDGLTQLELVYTNHLQVLAKVPNMRTVTELALRNCNMTPSCGAHLLESPWLGSLKRLDLSHNRLDGAWVSEMLAPSKQLRALEHLSLEGCHIGSRGLMGLAHHTPWAGLQSLNLRDCGIADRDAVGRGGGWSVRGIEALTKAPWLPQLLELDLGENDIGNEGARALARCDRPGRLERLELQRNRINGTGIAALMATPLLQRLRWLGLRGNHIGPEGATALANLPGTTLEQLDLSFNDIGDQGAATLAASPAFSRLKRLVLYRNRLLTEAVEALTRSPYLTQLQELQLGFNAIGDGGAEAIAQASSTWVNLRRLGLAQNQIGTVGALALAQSTLIAQLDMLDLHQNRIGPDGLRALANALADRPELVQVLPNFQATWEGEPPPAVPSHLPESTDEEDEQRVERLREALQRLIDETQ